jgi:glycosyltransferase involved in cell wall biosynthesis
MKILFIAPGDSLHTSRWIERVKSRGVDCVYYDMTSEALMHPIDITTIHRLNDNRFVLILDIFLRQFGALGELVRSSILTFRHYKNIRGVIKAEKPDLVHLHWLFHATSLATSFINGTPIVSTPWGSDLLIPGYKVASRKIDKLKHRFVISRVVKNSDAFCCDAQHMKDSLISYGAEAKAIQIIYFGTDIEVFSPSRRDQFFWGQFGLELDSIKVLSNRVLADMYDIETFIQASTIVHNKASGIDFIIAGGGPQTSSLKEFAKSNGTTKGITFTGRLNDEDFARATTSCDIYVSTSPTDGGIAASVAEAMSAAVPVVITDFGDNVFWLKNQTAGFIFQTGDEYHLADLILKLAGDEKMRKEMGQTGREVILKENNSRIEIEKILEMYRDLVRSE